MKIEKSAGTGSAETSILVDGGLVSGFPIGAFGGQTTPTIGILIYDKPGYNANIKTPVDVGVAMATFLVNFYDDLASRSSTKARHIDICHLVLCYASPADCIHSML